MEQIPALPSIIAKILVILDQALGAFATVSERPISDACGITGYYVNVTPTGDALVTNISQLLYSFYEYLSNYFAALTSVSVQ